MSQTATQRTRRWSRPNDGLRLRSSVSETSDPLCSLSQQLQPKLLFGCTVFSRSCSNALRHDPRCMGPHIFPTTDIDPNSHPGVERTSQGDILRLVTTCDVVIVDLQSRRPIVNLELALRVDGSFGSPSSAHGQSLKRQVLPQCSWSSRSHARQFQMSTFPHLAPHIEGFSLWIFCERKAIQL